MAISREPVILATTAAELTATDGAAIKEGALAYAIDTNQIYRYSGSAWQTEEDTDVHVADTSAAHAASAISVDSTSLTGVGTTVQAALEEIDDVADTATTHIADTTSPHLSTPKYDSMAGDIVIDNDSSGGGNGVGATPATTGIVLPGLTAGAEVHLVDIYLYVTSTTNGGVEISFTGPANATFFWRAEVYQAAGNILTFPDGSPGAIGTALNYITAALTEDIIHIHGVLTNVNTAGSFTVLAAQDTGHADNTVIHAESHMITTRIS